MIKREMSAYLDRVAKTFPVVAVTGPRQSGKTTLVKDRFPGYEYVNLENPDVQSAAEADGAGFFRDHPAPLIIDEVQRVPTLLSYVQDLVDADRKAKGRFILTGSHQPRLRAGIAQSLAGRVAQAVLLPLSLSELAAAGEKPDRGEAVYNGFMPRIYDEHPDTLDHQRNYLETYVERDVRQMIAVRDLRAFRTFLKLLAGRVGQLVNFESLTSDVGVSSTTLKGWLSVLEASNIVHLLPCYYRNFGKRFVKTPKVFFTDVGLASYLLGLTSSEQAARDPLFGNLFENMVVMEAAKFCCNKGLDPSLYFIRDRSGLEVDLVLEHGRKLHLFEIKSAVSYTPEFARNLMALSALTADVASKTVVYSGPTRLGNPDVAIVNFHDFAARLSHLAESGSMVRTGR